VQRLERRTPTITERLHGGYVASRRVRVLASLLSELIPQNSNVLDVGSGDGLLALCISRIRPDVTILGVDVLVRERTHIRVEPFDGAVLPYSDESFDVVLFVDVLHHTTNQIALLSDASRVTSDAVIVKDHLLEGFAAGSTLAFMDRTGNERHGVALPYQYLTRNEWFRAFTASGLRPETWRTKLGLYPFPASLVFGRSLHFAAKLVKG
jgi:SAM-dependent methyltransferase